MKQAEEKAQLARQGAELAATQRSAMEAQLKQAEEKAQQSAELPTTQRSAMEAQLKQAEEKAQLAQQSAELATTQRSAMEAQLKQAEEKAQQSAELATTQRSAMEAQLKQAEEKAQLAQQSAELALRQRNAMEIQLKRAEEKAQLAQEIADLPSIAVHKFRSTRLSLALILPAAASGISTSRYSKCTTSSKASAEMSAAFPILRLAPGIKRFLRPSTSRFAPARGYRPILNPFMQRVLNPRHYERAIEPAY